MWKRKIIYYEQKKYKGVSKMRHPLDIFHKTK